MTDNQRALRHARIIGAILVSVLALMTALSIEVWNMLHDPTFNPLTDKLVEIKEQGRIR